MTDHSKTLVAFETWSFAGPELKAAGVSVDLGLVAEALIYYETVYLNVETQPHLSALIRWCVDQGALNELLELLDTGTLRLLDFSFITTAVQVEGEYQLLNLQDAIQAQPGSFDQRYLYHSEIERVLPKSRHRAKLIRVCRGKVIELKAAQCGRGVDNAHRDALNPERVALVVQSFVDEAYRLSGRGAAPIIKARVTDDANGVRHYISWNINLAEVAQLIGPGLGYHAGQPLVALASANRLLWAAAVLDTDLYASRPMSRVIGDKLLESAGTLSATNELISELTVEVEFPDVRQMVNAGLLSLRDVLAIRRKAARFRSWLQSESERDRNAIIAYHHEVAKESGLLRAARRSLSVFGVLGSGAAGGALGAIVAGPGLAAALGAGAAGAGYLLDIASKLGTDWRPVVFGEWLRARTLSDRKPD